MRVFSAVVAALLVVQLGGSFAASRLSRRSLGASAPSSEFRALARHAERTVPELPSRKNYTSHAELDQRAKDFASKMKSHYKDGGFMKTRFALDLDPLHPRPEHPKPQLKREGRWESLNGPWQIKTGTGSEPSFGKDLDQDIIVPFAIEAPLGGLQVRGNKHNNMIYRRTFAPSLAQPGERLVLHVERADWHAKVWVNGKYVGDHKGGYGSFAFDVTDFAKNCTSGEANEIVIQVGDPTEWGMQPLGKQRAYGSEGIVYTSVSGIWGDVWMEYVPKAHISSIWFQTLDHSGTVRCHTNGSKSADGLDYLLAIYKDNDTLVNTQVGKIGTDLDFKLSDAEYWSPDNPKLYTVKAALAAKVDSGDKVVSYTGAYDSGASKKLPSDVQLDLVESYFGLRKVSLKNDSDGCPRIMLNDKFTFQVGFLDQGYMPDGIYTYPTDEALQYDLRFQQSLGANMIRKHMKVESDRWYYHAAKMGLLVWQDMPSGCGLENEWQYGDASTLNGGQWGWDAPIGNPGCWNANRTIDEATKANWRAELREIVTQHYYSPAVIQYSIFNEAWGQFDTVDVTKETMKNLDPGYGSQQQYVWSDASGWQDYEVGDMLDLHRYTSEKSDFTAKMRDVSKRAKNVTNYGASRAAVLGEYGGLKHDIDGHVWQQDKEFSSQQLQQSTQKVDSLQQKAIEELSWLGSMMLDPENGLNAGVFTQPFDVELENNGLQTYDRAVTKIDVEAYKKAARDVIQQSQKVKF